MILTMMSARRYAKKRPVVFHYQVSCKPVKSGSESDMWPVVHALGGRGGRRWWQADALDHVVCIDLEAPESVLREGRGCAKKLDRMVK